MSLLKIEYLALLRQWGRLQTQMDALQREHARHQAHWACDVMRLRAQLIIRDTQAYWGMGATRQLPHLVEHRTVEPAANVTQVICQVGCVSQTHAWLGPDDQCRLYGGDCDQLSLACPPPLDPPL